jgi:hypothetical protein
MSAILGTLSLGGFPWTTDDPFLFCVHHVDGYPAGDERLGPAASLAGRDLGQDFSRKDGWSMYHGTVVPGFPAHPHRGFETVTIARRGFIDHSDSLGAAARFGRGDVQWLTAGRGIVHAEMFPLLDRHAPNPVELFQIWLNLPSIDKLADPAFVMFWGEDLPRVVTTDEAGRRAEVTVVAGVHGAHRPPAPPPRSWAARPESDVAIWTVRLDAGATVRLPPAAGGASTRRTLYFFDGPSVAVDGTAVGDHAGLRVRPDVELTLTAGDGACELLLLQGRPIGEPIAQYGPFVMNTPAEIERAFVDYQRTQFGGWPWGSADPVHPRDKGRFARYPDGHVDER